MKTSLFAVFLTIVFTAILPAQQLIEQAVLSSPEGARIELIIDGKPSTGSQTTNTIIAFPLNAHVKLTLSKDGYESVIKEFVVTTDFAGIDEQLKPLKSLAPIEITTAPKADLYVRYGNVGEVLVGTADINGKALITFSRLKAKLPDLLSSGTFTLRIVATDHAAKEFPALSFQEQPQKLEANLAAKGVTITFTSQPIGAEIRRGDTVLGVTPFEASVSLEAELTLTANLEGYAPVTHTIAKTDLGTAPYKYDFGTLIRKSGELTLNLKIDGQPLPQDLIKDLKVFLDDSPRTLTGTRLAGVDLGTHKLFILHPSLNAKQLTVEMTDLMTSVDVDVEARSAVLAINNTVGLPYSVTLDGKPATLLAGDQFEIPAMRPVKVVVDYGQNRTVTREFNLMGGAQESWNVALDASSNPLPPVADNLRGDLRLPGLGIVLKWIPASPHGFWMGEKEITQSQYQTFGAPNPSATSFEKLPDTYETVQVAKTRIKMDAGRPVPVTYYANEKRLVSGGETKLVDNPVENLTAIQALEFCARLNSEKPLSTLIPQGYEFRLPTDSEWGFAYASGQPTRYFFGDNAAQLGAYAWYSENSNYKHHPVGEKKPSPYGLYDIAGNVAEWTVTIGKPASTKPAWLDYFVGTQIRGGGFNVGPEGCTGIARTPDSKNRATTGFRVVLAPKASLVALMQN